MEKQKTLKETSILEPTLVVNASRSHHDDQFQAAEAPEVPTFTELGWRGVDLAGWVGILAPKGLPPELANRLHREIVVATQHPSVVAYIKNAGNDVVTTTPAQFSAYLKSEVERYQKMLPPLGIKMD
jgi:tripartite-type tricarboxylate transporter receptor subunit TctC